MLKSRRKVCGYTDHRSQQQDACKYLRKHKASGRYTWLHTTARLITGQTITSQTASTNWTGQSRLFCSGRELDTTNLTPTYTTSSRLSSLRCVHAMQTSWLQNIYCSAVDYMMLWGVTHGRNRRYWGTSSMATWRSWGGQPPSWGRQASPSSVRRQRRRRLITDTRRTMSRLWSEAPQQSLQTLEVITSWWSTSS